MKTKHNMRIKIGINGFGRIGRLVFRAAINNKAIEVVAINDIDPNLENHAYLLNYDSVYGKFTYDAIVDDGKLVVNAKSISFYNKDCASWASRLATISCEAPV